MKCVPAITILISASLGIAAAQAPVFEVKPVAPPRGNSTLPVRITRSPQRIAFQSALIVDVMSFAYGLPADRIERRPQWMYDNRYDVAVTTAPPATLPEQKLLLQKLLEEKFGLAAHRISYNSPVYFLVAGPATKLTPAAEPDAADIPRFLRVPLGSGAMNSVYANGASMSDLAVWLYPQLQLPVIDKTGLTGLYDVQVTGMPLRGGAEGTIRAVRESLGLDLQLQQGTAESLIIDRSAQP